MSKATIKYEKANIVQKKIAFNKRTDKEILDYLERLNKPFQRYIKDLILKDMG